MTRTLEELREYLVGHWKFDNNFLDTSGNGNHGVPTDIEWNPTARGLKPKVLNRITCPSVHGNKLLSEFSIFAWVTVPTSNSASIISHGKDGTSGGYGYLLTHGLSSWEIGRLGIYYSSPDGDSYVRTPFDINYDENTFHFLGVTFNQGVFKFYLDGQCIDSIVKNATSVEFSDTIDTYIGREYSGTGGVGIYKGIFGSIYDYEIALTDDEVLALYNSTKNAVGVRPAERSFTHRLQPEVDANTVAAFDMSTKNSDGTLMDLSW